MPTTRTSTVPVSSKRLPKKSTAHGTKPFLRFYHSPELRARTLEVLELVESAERATEHSAQLTKLVLELTDSGMDQFFLQSLKAAKANYVVQQGAALGLSGVQKAMGAVIRNMVGRMDDRQLLSVCGSIRRFMA